MEIQAQAKPQAWNSPKLQAWNNQCLSHGFKKHALPWGRMGFAYVQSGQVGQDVKARRSTRTVYHHGRNEPPSGSLQGVPIPVAPVLRRFGFKHWLAP